VFCRRVGRQDSELSAFLVSTLRRQLCVLFEKISVGSSTV
jgi:hypothetical protein